MVANFATEGSTGANFDRRTAAPEFQTGLRQRGTNSRDYIYVRASGTIAAAASVKVTGSNDVWQAVSGAGQHVADVAFADGEYGWVRQRFSLPDEADEVDYDDTVTQWGVSDLQAAIEFINDNFSTTAHTHALDDLSDVSAAAPSVNDVIAWDGAAWAKTQRVRLVSQLGDVTLTGLAANEVLVWNGAAWVNEAENAHMHTLSDITDAGTLAGLDNISNGNWSGTDLAIENGGTGASTAAGARTNLGVAIGSDVQAFDAVLDSLSANSDTSGTLEKTGADTVGTYTVTTYAKTLLDDADASTARTTLELGALAVLDSVGSGQIDNNAVTNVELADMGEATFKMRAAGSGTGNPIDGTAAQAIAILQMADGEGSGLDADLLDGLHATAFATSAQGALAGTAVQPGGVGDDIGITADGSTTSRDLSARFADAVNVLDYGAIGDGVTDDSAAWQAAFDAAPNDNGVVYAPGGGHTYSIENVDVCNGANRTNFRLICDGIIKVPASAASSGLVLGDGTNRVRFCRFDIAAVVGTDKADGSYGITYVNGSHTVFNIQRIASLARGFNVEVNSGPVADVRLNAGLIEFCNRGVRLAGGAATASEHTQNFHLHAQFIANNNVGFEKINTTGATDLSRVEASFDFSIDADIIDNSPNSKSLYILPFDSSGAPAPPAAPLQGVGLETSIFIRTQGADGHRLSFGFPEVTSIRATGQVVFGNNATLSRDGTNPNMDIARLDTHGPDVLVGSMNYKGKDDGGNDQIYAALNARCVDDTDGSEDGRWVFVTASAGAVAARMFIGAGVYHPSVSGGDKGNNSINFGTIYQNNVPVATTSQNLAPSVAATDISDVANAINTANKVVGKMVWDTTNNRIMVASGTTAASAWFVADGSASVAPA